MFDHLKPPPLPEDRSFKSLFEWKVSPGEGRDVSCHEGLL